MESSISSAADSSISTRRCTEPAPYLWWAGLSAKCQKALPVDIAWSFEEGCECVHSNGLPPTCKFDSSHSVSAWEFRDQCDSRTTVQASKDIPEKSSTQSATSSATTTTTPVVVTSAAAVVLPSTTESSTTQATTLAHVRHDISSTTLSVKAKQETEDKKSTPDPDEPCIAVKQCEQCRCSKDALALDSLSFESCLYLAKAQNMQYFGYRKNPPRCEVAMGKAGKQCFEEKRTVTGQGWNVYRITCTSMSEMLPYPQRVQNRPKTSLATCNSKERDRISSDCQTMLSGSRQNRYDRGLCQCLSKDSRGPIPNCFWDTPSEKTVIDFFNSFCTKTVGASTPAFARSGFSQPVPTKSVKPSSDQPVSTVDRIIYLFSIIGLCTLAYYGLQCYRRFKLRQELKYEQVEIADSSKTKVPLDGYHTEKTAISRAKEPPDTQIYY